MKSFLSLIIIIALNLPGIPLHINKLYLIYIIFCFCKYSLYLSCDWNNLCKEHYVNYITLISNYLLCVIVLKYKNILNRKLNTVFKYKFYLITDMKIIGIRRLQRPESLKEMLVSELNRVIIGEFSKESTLDDWPTIVWGFFRRSRKSTVTNIVKQARDKTHTLRLIS